jgi:hypothetical protein
LGLAPEGLLGCPTSQRSVRPAGFVVRPEPVQVVLELGYGPGLRLADQPPFERLVEPLTFPQVWGC